MKEGASGIEPPTSRSAVERSTTGLHSNMPTGKKTYFNCFENNLKANHLFPKNAKAGDNLQ